jgi:hypothetical protein
MKKVLLLVLTVMLVSAFLMASGPSQRIVRLTIINKSGNEVMMKLEGSDLGKQFYYLTIPAGTKTNPKVSSFTILEDVYTRTTWYGMGKYTQCIGISNYGQLVMSSNVRLTFTDCYAYPFRTEKFFTPFGNIKIPALNNGEPTMEKVAFFYKTELGTSPRWDLDEDQDDYKGYGGLNVYWKRGCGNNSYYWLTTVNRVPQRGLCQWRYVYADLPGEK